MSFRERGLPLLAYLQRSVWTESTLLPPLGSLLKERCGVQSNGKTLCRYLLVACVRAMAAKTDLCRLCSGYGTAGPTLTLRHQREHFLPNSVLIF